MSLEWNREYKVFYSQTKIKPFEIKIVAYHFYFKSYYKIEGSRSSSPEVFLGKGVLKICSKFTGEHPCRSVILINLLCNLFKSHFSMGGLLKICCILSEHIFLWTPLERCFWTRHSEAGLQPCPAYMMVVVPVIVISLTLKYFCEIFHYISFKES